MIKLSSLLIRITKMRLRARRIKEVHAGAGRIKDIR